MSHITLCKPLPDQPTPVKARAAPGKRGHVTISFEKLKARVEVARHGR